MIDEFKLIFILSRVICFWQTNPWKKKSKKSTQKAQWILNLCLLFIRLAEVILKNLSF